MVNRTRILAAILSTVIAIGTLPTTALAAESEAPADVETLSEEVETVGEVGNLEEPGVGENTAEDAAENDTSDLVKEEAELEETVEPSENPEEAEEGTTEAAIEASTEAENEIAQTKEEFTEENGTEAEKSDEAGTAETAAEAIEVSAEEEDEAPKKKSDIDMSGARHYEGKIGKFSIGGKSGEERFEEYVDNLFYGNGTDDATKKARSHSGYKLKGAERAIYDQAASVVENVAAGKADNTEFDVYLDDLGLDPEAVYTAKDLGLTSLTDSDGNINEEVYDVLGTLYDFDLRKVTECLFNDYPYECYWSSYDIWYYTAPPFETNGKYLWFDEEDSWFGMPVENQFRAVRDTDNEEDFFSVDLSRISAASKAATNAANIVKKAAEKSDLDKLWYYRDQILSLSSYNHEAADTDNYSESDRGPWALIYVFDNDPNTNVVCEGYSRAFQYLSDRTQFNNSSIRVYSVGGEWWDSESIDNGGFHEWNIVHMDDGRNYIADITNSDDDGYLFLCGMEQSEGNPHIYFTKGDDYYMVYLYDEVTTQVYSSNELTLSFYDYGEDACEHEYGAWETVQKKTCEVEGIKEKQCIYCGDVVSQITPPGHTWNTDYTVDIKPTLTKYGEKSIHCKYCDETTNHQRVPKLISVSKASVSGISTKTYTGKNIAQYPSVVVNLYNLKKGQDYKLSYKNNMAVGIGTVTIIGIGRYGGSISKNFAIIPKGTTLVSLTPATKKMTVKWKKQAAQTTGYQIQYSFDKSFKTGTKTITKKGTSTVSLLISGLKSKKKYYVRIRTYKTIGTKNYYSAWSALKAATIR